MEEFLSNDSNKLKTLSKGDIVEGKIVDIDDYTKSYGKEALVYYWVTPKRNIFVRLYDNLRYRYSVLFKKPFKPRFIFFTHSVLFGTDIFQTEEEAETQGDEKRRVHLAV